MCISIMELHVPLNIYKKHITLQNKNEWKLNCEGMESCWKGDCWWITRMSYMETEVVLFSECQLSFIPATGYSSKLFNLAARQPGLPSRRAQNYLPTYTWTQFVHVASDPTWFSSLGRRLRITKFQNTFYRSNI